MEYYGEFEKDNIYYINYVINFFFRIMYVF